MKERTKRLNQIATVVAKVMEVSHWVAQGLLIVAFVLYFCDESLLRYVMDMGNGEFGLAGYSINVLDAGGSIVPEAFIPALILGIIVCGLMAMIFRNIYLIFKTSMGKTKFSKGETPFQPDTVRMVREIGIFSLSIPIVEWIIDVLAKIIVGHEAVESSISVSGLVFGIALLCLSQIFAYGAQLQQDSDGLV